jgi:phage terminase large subunit-like protein
VVLRHPGSALRRQPARGYPYRHARADQWPPPGTDWFLWFLMGGRGSGKTRTGAEYVRQLSKKVRPDRPDRGDQPGGARHHGAGRVSGLEAVFAAYGERIDYKPALRRITFPSGAIARPVHRRGAGPPARPAARGVLAGRAEPLPADRRGLGPADVRACGSAPGRTGVCTSTPLPNKWTKARIADEKTRLSPGVHVREPGEPGPAVPGDVLARYEGTRLGRQELEGEILEDVEGALWRADADRPGEHPRRRHGSDRRLDRPGRHGQPPLRRDRHHVVGRGPDRLRAGGPERQVQPAGLGREGRSGRTGFYKADAIVAEKNFGGDMVKTTIESTGRTRARVIVTTASRSKALRAEPIVALYEQSRILHNGVLAELEEEMLTWVPGMGHPSPRTGSTRWCTASPSCSHEGDPGLDRLYPCKPDIFEATYEAAP